MQTQEGLGRLKKVQNNSGRFGSIIKSAESFDKVHEGLGRFKNVQEGSNMFN